MVALYGNEGLAPSPLHTLLAQHFRVIAIEIPDLGRELVEERPSSPRIARWREMKDWCRAFLGVEPYFKTETLC